jgi:hypothetical protein
VSSLKNRITLLLIVILLAACASPGGKLQQAGSTATVFDMQVTSNLDWARIKGPRQELWTIDGVSLNSLAIYSGIKPNEHVFMLGREKKSNPNGPWYRTGLRADELRDVIIDGLKGQGWVNIVTSNFRPHDFAGKPGIRFDLSLTNPDGLIYRGSVAAIENGGNLNLLFWKAPAEYYAPRDAAAVAGMLDGVRIP